MGDVEEHEVVSALHGLYRGKKVRPGEVFKDFNHFLRSRNEEISKDISIILDGFYPDSPLGKLLRAKLIDRYKVSSGVIDSLQSGNSLYINQALKCDWFFASVEDPSTFVQNMIPSFSFSTRMKVLNKYALCLKNTNAGEVLYLSLKSRYGLRTAIVLMPACSEAFIKKELPNVAILLPRSVVQALYDKYPSLVTEYIKNILGDKSSKRNTSYQFKLYGYVFVKLSIHDLDSLLDLIENHESSLPCMRLGRRPTKKLIQNNFNRFSSHYDKYSNFVCKKTFMKRLSLDKIKQLYVSNWLPQTVSDFLQLSHWGDVFEVLDWYLKPSLRSDVFTSTFQIKYNRSCTSDDLLHELPSFMLKYLPTDAKIKYVEMKLEDKKDLIEEADYISHLPVELSIPRLKKLITSQSGGSIRSQIAEKMVVSLKINNCSSGIKDLVTFFVKRFRNEVPQFRSDVISKLSELENLYLDLEMDDWAPIFDFINIIKLNNEFRSCVYYVLEILGYHVRACFMKNLEVDPCLRKFMDYAGWGEGDLDYGAIRLCRGTPYQRNCLEWLLKELPKMKWKKVTDKDNFYGETFGEVYNFNSNHSGNEIKVPQRFIEEMIRIVGENSVCGYRSNQIIEWLTSSKDCELMDQLLTRCLPNFAPHCWVLCRFLKTNPDLILSNSEPIMKKLFDEKKFRTYCLFYKKCRLYDSFGITAKIIELCHKVLEQDLQKCTEPSTTSENVHDDSDHESTSQLIAKPCAIEILALLQEPTDYLNLCSEHVPKQAQVECSSTATVIEYNMQAAICKSFTRISNPSEALPVLYKFCVGDFLKLTCDSLTAVCIRIPESAILPLLNEWMDCPVSLRKHVLRLVYRIAPADYSVDTFVNFFRTEKNTSLRLVLFKNLRDTFITEPSEDSYKMFNSIIDQLTEEDAEILEILFELHEVDDAFLSRYLELLWHHIDSTWKNSLRNGNTKLIDVLERRMVSLLDNTFADKLLLHDMSTKLPNSNLSQYVYYYLLCCSSRDIQRHRLDTFVNVMTPFIKQHWDDRNFLKRGTVFRIRNIVDDVVETTCRLSQDCEESYVNPSQLFTDLIEKLSTLIKPIDFLDYSILLDWHSMYHQQERGDASALETATAALCIKYIHEYENQIGYCIVLRLKNAAQSWSHSLSCSKLAFKLMKTSEHPYAHVLALEIVDTELSNEEDVPEYEQMVEIVSSSKDPLVQSSSSQFLRSLRTSCDLQFTLVSQS